MKNFWVTLSILCFCLIAAGSPKDLKIQFIIDEDYLISYTMMRNPVGMYIEDVNQFKDMIWDLDKKSYNQIRYYENHNPQALSLFVKEQHKEFVASIKKSKLYENHLRQTQDYIQTSLKEWEKNLPVAYDFMKRITGQEFNNEITVYITHPAVGNGRMWDKKKNIISFGAWPQFDNYFTVYIWHEIMHLYLPLDPEAHAIIQLATDNALREKMNGTTHPPFVGHESLFPLMENILPLWQNYLAKPDGIERFYLRIKRDVADSP